MKMSSLRRMIPSGVSGVVMWSCSFCCYGLLVIYEIDPPCAKYHNSPISNTFARRFPIRRIHNVSEEVL